MDVTKITLDENELPKRWYNIAADLPTPLDPPLNPQTKEPITPDDLSAIFPMSLIKQEMSTDRWIDIPSEVRDIYTLWRPTPLYRAMRLEKALKTPAKIYYKWEGVSPPGSHKPNTAVAQDCNRNRSRAVGICALVRHTPLRSRMHCVHGQDQLRSETIPQGNDGDVGREGVPEPEQ